MYNLQGVLRLKGHTRVDKVGVMREFSTTLKVSKQQKRRSRLADTRRDAINTRISPTLSTSSFSESFGNHQIQRLLYTPPTQNESEPPNSQRERNQLQRRCDAVVASARQRRFCHLLTSTSVDALACRPRRLARITRELLIGDRMRLPTIYRHGVRDRVDVHAVNERLVSRCGNHDLMRRITLCIAVGCPGLQKR